MKLNSSQLEAFFSVAKILNFTQASRGLNITQSALSQRIAKLEDDLGVALFIRDRSSIRLTEYGEKLLRYCQLHESSESELLANLKESSKDLAGVIRVGGFSSVNRSLVIPSFRKIMEKNPRLSIQLITKEMTELEPLLRTSEADYIFTTLKSNSPDFESILLGYEENVLVQSKKSSDTGIFLDHDEKDLTTKNYFSQSGLSFKPSNMRYLDDVYGLLDGVKNGYGKAVLPLHLIKDEKCIEIINPKHVLKVPVFLQYYVQPYYRRSHEQILSQVTEHFKKHLRQN
ncbi:MAG: LysR family transcriptional regulator [Bdellovibrionia bacterium]